MIKNNDTIQNFLEKKFEIDLVENGKKSKIILDMCAYEFSIKKKRSK